MRCALGDRVARPFRARLHVLTGQEAERLGMVSKAVPREEVLDEALRVTGTLYGAQA